MFFLSGTKKAYDYETLEKNIEKFKIRYPFCDVFSIGESVNRKKIYCIKAGWGENTVFYNGAHHGAEWITSALLMKFLGEYMEAYISGKDISETPAEFLLSNVTLYVVPMVNPDGVDLSINGGRVYTADFPRLFKQNNNSSDFTKWQANFNGVDLNHNYDAMWEHSRQGEKEHGILGPGPTRYAGETPFSEPETIALKEFTEKTDIKLAMAFHSQGQEVYYGFNDKEPIYSLFLANALTLGTPYTPTIPEGIASYGGYKDWFIETTGKVCFTIEVGKGENPLPLSDLPQIYKETKPILIGGMKASCII